MVNIKVLLQQIKLTFPMSLALMGFPQIQAQPTKPISFVQRSIISSNKQLNKPFIFDAPPLPPDVGASSGHGAGGSRGVCENLQMIALAPVYKRLQDSKGSEVIWGLTTKEHPTLWFYVPESLTSDRPGKLSLQNQQKEDINTPPVMVMGTLPGIVSVTLSPAIAPLEIGKKYSWSFRTACDPADRFGGYSVVGGWIQRIKPDDRLKKQLEKAATSRERALLYAKAGIWYDSVTELCSSAKDTNLATDWAALLQSIHLDEVKEQTVPCGAIKQ